MAQASKLTVLEAGRLVGRSKSHIFRAIKSGALSAERDATGTWRIDRAELARIFPPHQEAHQDAEDDLRRFGQDAAMVQLEARLADALDQVSDLRTRLDTATAQLGEALQQVRLLTDQRQAPVPAPTPPPRRTWWRWRRT
jgi:excisionase family DNA binding protein